MMVGINKPCYNHFKQSSLISSDPTTKKYSIQTLTLSIIPINLLYTVSVYKTNKTIQSKGLHCANRIHFSLQEDTIQHELMF